MADRLAGWVRRHAPSPSTNHLIVAAICVSVLVLSLAAATLMFTLQGRASDEARDEQAQVSACRASLSARLVTGPTADALQALALQGADSPEFLRAAQSADPDEFIRLSVLSDSDPEAFLVECSTILAKPPP